MYICIMNLSTTLGFNLKSETLFEGGSRCPNSERVLLFKDITCKAQGSHNASREYVTEKRSLSFGSKAINTEVKLSSLSKKLNWLADLSPLSFKTNGILFKDSLKLVSNMVLSVFKRPANQAAGIKDKQLGHISTERFDADFRGGTVTPFKDNREQENVSFFIMVTLFVNKTFPASLFYGYSESQLSEGVCCALKIGSDFNQLKQDTKCIVENPSCELPIKTKSISRECVEVVQGVGERCEIIGEQQNSKVELGDANSSNWTGCLYSRGFKKLSKHAEPEHPLKITLIINCLSLNRCQLSNYSVLLRILILSLLTKKKTPTYANRGN